MEPAALQKLARGHSEASLVPVRGIAGPIVPGSFSAPFFLASLMPAVVFYYRCEVRTAALCDIAQFFVDSAQ